jgi:hypothetical protein
MYNCKPLKEPLTKINVIDLYEVYKDVKVSYDFASPADKI